MIIFEYSIHNIANFTIKHVSKTSQIWRALCIAMQKTQSHHTDGDSSLALKLPTLLSGYLCNFWSCFTSRI